MQELIVVIPDLYLPHESDRVAAPAISLPGLEHIARYGNRMALPEGWRRWLARWLIGDDRLGDLAPAVIAAAALPPSAFGQSAGSEASGPATVWMATPVHLIASLTSLHLDQRSVQYLPADERRVLTSEFERTFEGSGYFLAPLDSGELLLCGPALADADTSEPARSMGESVAAALPRGPGAAALRRVGAEIEMWLHEHALNDARIRRGEPAVTSLWMWGGGPIGPDISGMGGPDARGLREAGASALDARMAFGADAYVQGLWALMGGKVMPLPGQLAEVFSYPHAHSGVLVVEVGRMLHSNHDWTVPDAVAEIDRLFLRPAVHALHRGALKRLDLLVNDFRLCLRAVHRLRLWRRASPGLSGLL